MILVTLGTQDKSFKRLLDAIEKEISSGNIKDKVIVQAGYTKYESNNMEIFDLIPREEFNKLIKECDFLITHGGVGSILNGLKNNKKVIAAARLKEYKEHTNNHQLQILDNLKKEGYILVLEDFDKLNELLLEVNNFKPKKFKSNTNKIIKIVENFIDNN